MRAKDLIERLKELPPDTTVFVWVDGERYPLYEAVDYWDEHSFVDLNAVVDKAES